MSSILNRWLEKMPAKTIKGNNSDAESYPEDLTVSELLQMLNLSISFPRYRIQQGIDVVVGNYEQYVIHGRKELMIDSDGSITVSAGGEIIIK